MNRVVWRLAARVRWRRDRQHWGPTPRDSESDSTAAAVPEWRASRQGITSAHVARCLTAAKNPKLESKLINMPVRLSIDTVERYMGSVLAAAGDGDFSLIEDVQVK